jgi:hypothetical protein
MTEPINPCPCGGKPVPRCWHERWHYLECENCKRQGPTSAQADWAVEMWNEVNKEAGA